MVTIELKTRRCGACNAEAVSLEGFGTNCHVCRIGEFGEHTGETIDAEVSPHVADQYREKYPREIAE